MNSPGAVRAIYNDADRGVLDVIYHDDTLPKPAKGRWSAFSKATYHSSAELKARRRLKWKGIIRSRIQFGDAGKMSDTDDGAIIH